MSRPIQTLVDWLDDRTGMRKLTRQALDERVPGGARWRYVWGSTLVVAFVTQAVTGLFLWMAYSPSTQTAWESVTYIQHEMTGGWLLRGIHHYMAHVMVLLLGLHLLQVVVDGAYRAPRELNFVLGLVLMLLVLGLALTGYLLPWDQKGYWATKVSTELASQTPVIGSALKSLAVGGTEYGHHTLTRFFAFHAGLLPTLLVLVLVLHVALFRRHGLHARDPNRAPDASFWPDQLLKDSVAALGVLTVVLTLTIYYGGAELSAPADPANPYAAARPETYFLFLFQFLKWFPGEAEVWGAIVIPSIVLAVLFLMPWIARSRGGHVKNVILLFCLIGGAAALTAQAIRDDYLASWTERTDANAEQFDASATFLAAKHQAQLEAERILELARAPEKIPPTGALTLMHEDPYLQGPKLFAQHCASCHNYVDPQHPDSQLSHLVNEKPTAPNLFGIGSRQWISGLLDPKKITSPHYFGYEGSPFVGDAENTEMVDFIQESLGEDIPEPQRKEIRAAFQKIAAALSAEAKLPLQDEIDRRDQETIAEGRALIEGDLADVLESGSSCTDCHSFGEMQDIGSPVLDGYMSRAWLIDFIRNPADERFYGEINDRMPAFAPHANARLNQLDEKSLGLIVDWLRGDWHRAGARR